MQKVARTILQSRSKCVGYIGALLLLLCHSMSIQPAKAQTFTSILSLEFGNLASNGAGTVTMATASSTRTKTGGVVLASGGTVRRGRVVVNGTANTTINITVPASVTVTGSGGGSGTLVVAVNNGLTQTLSGTGTLTIRFGGTLTFTGTVPPGSFSATVPIDISY